MSATKNTKNKRTEVKATKATDTSYKNSNANKTSLSDERVSQRGTGGIPRPRIQTLSDLIFGLALSISSLTLIGQQPATSGQFFIALALYALSFFILVSVWRSYSAATSVLPSETSILTSLNIVLLFLVSVEPYIFAELFDATGGSFPSIVSEVYAFDVGFMFLIMALFNNTLASEERGLVPRSLLGRYRSFRNQFLTVAAIFIVSSLPFFGSVNVFTYTMSGRAAYLSLRATLWVVALIAGWSSRLMRMGKKSKDETEGAGIE
jgi:uncharacterized membrane protein